MPQGLAVGSVFSELTVLDSKQVRKRIQSKNNTTYYGYFIKCLCSCNKIVFIREHKIKNGLRKSCGHLRYTQRLELTRIETVMIADVLRRLKKNAGKGKLRCWNLSDADTIELIKGNCFYCGRPPQNILQYGANPIATNRVLYYNGIDRLNNVRGYTKLNSVSCCGDCNVAKRSQSLIDFLSQIKLIYENIKLQYLSENLLEVN